MIIGLLEEYGKFKYLCAYFSSKDTGETRNVYVWSDNVKFMWDSNTNNIIEELFESFLHNYQDELKIISGSEFIFKSVELMDYKLHREVYFIYIYIYICKCSFYFLNKSYLGQIDFA